MKFSESTKNIFKALSEFRKNIIQPQRDALNPFFKAKYVPLENVISVIDRVAPEYGLSIMQNSTSNEQGAVGAQTIITHESGEYIIFDWLFIRPDKNTAQGQGSALTYARRYSLSSALGIASEVDDDGNEASGNRDGKVNKGDKDLPQKQIFLSEKSEEFTNKYGINRNTFYAGLGQRLNTPDAIQKPLKDLIETAKIWQNELDAGNSNVPAV